VKQHNNVNDEIVGKVIKNMLLYLIKLVCQLIYF